MNLKALFEDDGAVSPVIGVILMVAITVILAAVIGTFVLGLGDRVSQASPNSNFAFEYTAVGNNNVVNVTHDGGDGVQASQANVSVGGTNAYGTDDGAVNGFSVHAGSGWTGKLTAGSQLSLDDSGSATISDGQTVKVIWNAEGSDKTAVIGESEVDL
ncbi:type IV pilin N-terminal domain-containing protein [Halorussus caseinilyticus]|uniref:Type IV pilin N-terminal domain-containing protein n=1 Tax=Halorussus caseinilyticus TaxID=3034025 RepID=A0ABD5WM66_9EURY|nr:type IV pilin N-terminal domain-containing protein [Halorussus sp. DT72]